MMLEPSEPTDCDGLQVFQFKKATKLLQTYKTIIK